MRFGDLLLLVWANLWRTRGRAIMSAVGVGIGTAAIVVLISLAAGLQRMVTGSLSVLGSMRQITLLGGNISQAFGIPGQGTEARITPRLLKEIADEPGVVAVTPYESLMGPAQIYLDRLLCQSTLAGIDERQSGRLEWQAARGSIQLGNWQVIAGGKVAEAFLDPRHPERKLEAQDLYGRTLRLELTRTDADGRTLRRTLRLRVSGVLETQGGGDDYSLFIGLKDLEELNAWLDGRRVNRERVGYSRAIILMEEVEQVIPLETRLLQRGYLAISATSSVKAYEMIFAVLQAILGGVGAIALIVAGVGIANTLTMAILERTREIGLMKAVGATNREVMSIFLGEAGLIGAGGGIVGMLTGVALTQLINLIIGLYLTAQTGSTPETAIIFTPLWLLPAVVIFAGAMGVLSGIYPAQRATRLNPVVALKYE